MKIKPEHYNVLKSMIGQYSHDNREALLAHKALKLGKDPEKRFRWDLFYCARRVSPDRIAITDSIQYLNSDHLDTALKRIVRELGL